VELLLRHNNKKLITHVNRIKPYFVQKPAAVTSPDFFPAEKPATPPPVACNKKRMKIFFPTIFFHVIASLSPFRQHRFVHSVSLSLSFVNA
jgi:hypothetical protein